MNQATLVLKPKDRQQLLSHLRRVEIVRWSENLVTFKSGIQSHFYVSGREELTSDPEALRVVGKCIALAAITLRDEMVHTSYTPCLIGIPSAGTPLAVAAVVANPLMQPVRSRTMRALTKAYGMHTKIVDGVPRGDEFYVTVDNVITDGATKLEAIERILAEGYPRNRIAHIVLVDRQQGGSEHLRGQDHTILGLLPLEALVEDLVLSGDWPPDRLETLRKELDRDFND